MMARAVITSRHAALESYLRRAGDAAYCRRLLPRQRLRLILRHLR